MRIGVVSNCWQQQLESGERITDLIAQATRLGFTCVELRQTCLGRFERGDPPIPDASAIGELPAAFPEVAFNIAINVPFLRVSNTDLREAPVFAAAAEAARSVSGNHQPHLRLVDLATAPGDFAAAECEPIASQVSRLLDSTNDGDGQLSIEHSLQSWPPFLDVFRTARRVRNDGAHRLRLCYDPVNLFFGDADPDPGQVTRSLKADEISMVHFKQRRDGEVLPRMDDGDVDWRDQAQAFDSIGYRGPFLFEIRSTANVWQELQASIDYLRNCGFTLPM